MEWAEIIQIGISVVIGTGIGKVLGIRALKGAARVIDDLADGKITAEEAKRQKRELTKMLNWLKKKIKKSNYLLLIVPMLAILFGGCMSSQTGTVQSSAFQYGEGSADPERTPYITMSVHILFRSNPSPGAVERFTDQFGGFINDLNIPAAVVSGLTSPERMVSDLGNGTQARITPQVRLPVLKGRKTSGSIKVGPVREAARKALKKAELDSIVDGVYVENVEIKAKSVPVPKGQKASNDETQGQH